MTVQTLSQLDDDEKIPLGKVSESNMYIICVGVVHVEWWVVSACGLLRKRAKLREAVRPGSAKLPIV